MASGYSYIAAGTVDWSNTLNHNPIIRYPQPVPGFGQQEWWICKYHSLVAGVSQTTCAAQLKDLRNQQVCSFPSDQLFAHESSWVCRSCAEATNLYT
jgi:hypothetical protein